jgi:hypothetical protein
VPTSVCTELLMPGVNPATYLTDYAATIADLGTNLAAASTVAAEPALRCYVTDTCAAAVASVPAPAASAPAPAPSQVRAGTLAATGVDLDGRMLVALMLLGLAVAARRTVRST